VEGSVLVEHVKGPLELVTQKGGVSVFECAGPVTITARGDVDTRNVYGAQIIEGRGGKTVVDAPRAELKVQQVGGDVYVIPLDGIHGNYDMIAEGGDVNILIPESADATILATTRNGTVQSAFTLTGEKSRGYERFQGRRKEGIPGKYQVVLETIDGDIIID